MVEQAAGRLEQLEHLIEVVAVVLRAHMFHHAHRGDAVEVSFRHFAVSPSRARIGLRLLAIALRSLDPVLTVLVCSCDSDTPSALMPRLAAAMTRAPQPHPSVEHAVAGLEVQACRAPGRFCCAARRRPGSMSAVVRTPRHVYVIDGPMKSA